MTDLLQLTINAGKSHCQPQCTPQLMCEDRVLFVGQQESSCLVLCFCAVERPLLFLYSTRD